MNVILRFEEFIIVFEIAAAFEHLKAGVACKTRYYASHFVSPFMLEMSPPPRSFSPSRGSYEYIWARLGPVRLCKVINILTRYGL